MTTQTPLKFLVDVRVAQAHEQCVLVGDYQEANLLLMSCMSSEDCVMTVVGWSERFVPKENSEMIKH